MAIASSVSHCLISNPPQLKKGFTGHGWSGRPAFSFSDDSKSKNGVGPIKATVQTPPFPLLQPPQPQESPSELEPADPDFYKIGYVRSMRAFGVEFKEGPDGFGVNASKDVEPLRRARVGYNGNPTGIDANHKPESFHGCFFPISCPLVIPSLILLTQPIQRTSCPLSFVLISVSIMEVSNLYSDFLPGADECTSLLLASEEELLEQQDVNLASTIRGQQPRALEFWEKNWHNSVPLKIKRLARNPERFIWAVSIAQSRCINMQTRIGALVQDANMLTPYAESMGCDPILRECTYSFGFLLVGRLSNDGDTYVDGVVIAAARTLPTWSDGDVPPIPTSETRPVDPQYAAGHKVMFSDQYPFMLLSQGSMDALNKLLKEPIPINRIVVSGCKPFSEDVWTEIKINEFTFEGVKLCSRCKVMSLCRED
ncbi:hypothetical protein TIFTF001_037335 [Ficus carica]|uniref:MOSC domain-containing protein n=1 Tax=Ficus carica TaxID=3494 RepID=A0AA88E6V5_FICCA|nr:hypothetical protein TIFTF001_037335 [Ficus carica]